MADQSPAENLAAYWQREHTINGRKTNDALDYRADADERKNAANLPEADRLRIQYSQDKWQRAKQKWRAELDNAGEVVTPRRRDKHDQAGTAERAAAFWGSTRQAGRDAAPAQQESQQRKMRQ